MSQNPLETTRWLSTFHDSERGGQFVADGEGSLNRERALLARLGNPQRAYTITHIAGTKGKGSTSAMLAAMLHAAGMRTGLYTQPDLHTWHERIRLNEQTITEAEALHFLPPLKDALARLDAGSYLTYEVVTALALLAFQDAHVEQAVIEVGLGGRLDATNVVEPAVTVITSISYDHMAFLGPTLADIAREKGGIIKPGIPLVCSAQAPEAVEVLTRICAERGAPLLRVGPAGTPGCAYQYQPLTAESDRQWGDIQTPQRTYRNLELRLLGTHQLENATAAIAAAEQLQQAGASIDEAAIRQGLQAVNWPGRLQVIGQQPWVVVDGTHNADSFAKLFAALRRHFPFKRLLLVVGVMADKDLAGIVSEIAQAGVDEVFVTPLDHPRSAQPDRIAKLLEAQLPLIDIHTDPNSAEALAHAKAAAWPLDLICVAGSVALAGEALRWFSQQP
ncbi:MAG TPA: folylpolyglutamate synthase/dihydrofolate synthase family protein [Ktedonobacterales bacterium]|nr:folylpolyglutamate synthase/dihydrofolate synthase family protein [Ktedonobacterales bacterium]